MDSLIVFRQAVKETLENYAKTFNNGEGVEMLLVFDEARDEYLVLRHGWAGKKRINHIPIFVRIQNEKIFVEEDWTDRDIVGQLMAYGIGRERIVLAFHHPSLRPFTDFATG